MFDFTATSRLNDGGISPFYGYGIDQSCRFNDDDSAYLSRTPSGAPDDAKKQTYSIQLKRCELGAENVILNATQTTEDFLHFSATDHLRFVGTGVCDYVTTAVYRDVGSWYHIHLVFDSTEATASDRVKISINGIDSSWKKYRDAIPPGSK